VENKVCIGLPTSDENKTFFTKNGGKYIEIQCGLFFSIPMGRGARTTTGLQCST